MLRYWFMTDVQLVVRGPLKYVRNNIALVLGVLIIIASKLRLQ